MAAAAISASEVQQRLLTSLRQFPDLRTAPDDLVPLVLRDSTATEQAIAEATTAIYVEAYYRCAKDSQITEKEQRLLDRLIAILALNDEQVLRSNYRVGLSIYKKRFRNAVADGRLDDSRKSELDALRRAFGLRTRDIHGAISEQALAYYSFRLSDALRDGVLGEAEMCELALVARELGLTSSQLKSISVPNKKDILATALASIKARGEIRPQDHDHIRALAEYLNATNDLLKPCLMDLELYERLFAIRTGKLPEIDSKDLILERGEPLHYSVRVTFEVAAADRIRRQGGTLYIGGRRMRFVGLRRSHEMRYANLLRVDLAVQKQPKLTIAVARGTGSGTYRLTGMRDPGTSVELHEAIRFLIRKAKGLEVRHGTDTRYITDEIRSEIWYRDAGRCVLCGATEYLEFDHIIPHSKGGATSAQNLQLLCRKCNSEKSDTI
ncbi:MAG: HNH endonuclease signature motif containing protein [Planctomycetaceae bacterium]